MSGHLCLKWNNHSSAFLTSIGRIQLKSRFCDATIACQGKYFPVHRMILSTCSEYFDELFDRMQCQHPYIVFKDIEPKEMELLLNYMYQGEVNVVQEMLPTLIKAAEALKIKGLAVSDDIPSKDTSSPGRKRSSTSSNKDNDQPKRTLEESRKRRRLVESSSVAGRHANNESSDDSSRFGSTEERQGENNSVNLIKQEPSDTMAEYEDTSMGTEYNMGLPPPGGTMELLNKEEIQESSSAYIKTENPPDTEEVYTDQAGWSDFGSESAIGVIETSEMGSNDDIPPGGLQIKVERGFLRGERTSQNSQFIGEGFSQLESADNALHYISPLNPQEQEDVKARQHPSIPLTPQKATTSQYHPEKDNPQQHHPEEATTSQYHPKEATTSQYHPQKDNPPPNHPQRYSTPQYHSCSLCDYKSPQASSVKRHMLYKHTGERPFSCFVCGFAFTEKSSLRRHLRVHSGEKPFKCDVCLKPFNTRSGVVAHKLTHVGRSHAR